MTTTGFTVNGFSHFPEEFVDQLPGFFMGSLDVDSLFTNMPFAKTIKICKNEFFKVSKTVQGLSRPQFKELLSRTTKD